MMEEEAEDNNNEKQIAAKYLRDSSSEEDHEEATLFSRRKHRGRHYYTNCFTCKVPSSHRLRIRRCPRCCYRDICTLIGYHLGAILILVSVVLFIVLGVLLCQPYLQTLSYREANCSVLVANMTGHLVTCPCSGPGCKSSFPCLQVQVIYQDSAGQMHTGMIHESQLDLKDYGKLRCVWRPRPCNEKPAKNTASVERYLHSNVQEGRSLPCLYDPEHYSDVIRKRSGNHWLYVHAVIWPTLVGAVGATVVLVTGIYKGCGACQRTCLKQRARRRMIAQIDAALL